MMLECLTTYHATFSSITQCTQAIENTLYAYHAILKVKIKRTKLKKKLQAQIAMVVTDLETRRHVWYARVCITPEHYQCSALKAQGAAATFSAGLITTNRYRKLYYLLYALHT